MYCTCSVYLLIIHSTIMFTAMNTDVGLYRNIIVGTLEIGLIIEVSLFQSVLIRHYLVSSITIIIIIIIFA